MTDVMTAKKSKKQKAAYPLSRGFPEAIEALYPQVQIPHVHRASDPQLDDLRPSRTVRSLQRLSSQSTKLSMPRQLKQLWTHLPLARGAPNFRP
jgi:hypothetical protein